VVRIRNKNILGCGLGKSTKKSVMIFEEVILAATERFYLLTY